MPRCLSALPAVQDLVHQEAFVGKQAIGAYFAEVCVDGRSSLTCSAAWGPVSLNRA